MFIVKFIVSIFLFCFFTSNSFAKQTSFSCKPNSAAAVRSNGIHVFKITGKEKPIEVTIIDGQNKKSALFVVNNSKYKMFGLGGSKDYAFNEEEPWTHIQDIFFINDKTLSFVLAVNASITRYLCDEIK
jgi:S-adenosylhomocysteine hydrolase